MNKRSPNEYKFDATMLLSSGRIDLVKLCKSFLFLNGVLLWENRRHAIIVIGNFHNEEMGVILELNGREVPFNIGNYMKPFKLVVQKDDN